MPNHRRLRGLRPLQLGAIVTGLALVGLSLGALGAASGKPKMQVSPSTKDLSYHQTVRVRAQNLPKGSGTIALTICGLNDKAGKKIATVGADDCAGADDLSSGLVKLQENKNGTFDQTYVLPKSGQKFGKHQRFCDAKHYCALVVADANPDKPAYHVETKIFFRGQKATTPTTKPKGKSTPTTKPKAKPKPKPTTTTTTTTAPVIGFSGGGRVNDDGTGTGTATIKVNPPKNGAAPTTPPGGKLPNPVPPEAATAVTDVCGQLADVIKQGGGDATALTLACSSLVNGGGGAQLQSLLTSPSLGCIAASGATQGNEQLADACAQLTTALKPYSSQLGDALSPVLGLLP